MVCEGRKKRRTFKLRSPQHQPPPNCRLGLEVRSEKKGRMLLGMERERESYRHTIAMDGNSKWQNLKMRNLTWITNYETRRVSENRD